MMIFRAEGRNVRIETRELIVKVEWADLPDLLSALTEAWKEGKGSRGELVERIDAFVEIDNGGRHA